MRTVLLNAPGQFTIHYNNKPEIEKDTDVLLKIAYVGVCGSDIHYFRHGSIGDQDVDYPFVVGHECSAIVDKVGPAVTSVKPDDHVVLDPAISCGACDQCLMGREHTCHNQKFLGCPGQIEGCMSDFFIMPETCCIKIPDKIGLDIAPIIEPLAIGIYAVESAMPVRSEANIAIQGAGPIGLSVLTACKTYTESSVCISDPISKRREMAKCLGANHSGMPSFLEQEETGKFDIVFECCGEQQALDQAVKILTPGGKLIIAGIPEPERVNFDIHSLRRKEISIQNVRRQNNCMQKAIDIMMSGQADVAKIATHYFPAEKAQQAYAMVSGYKDGVIKALIDFINVE